MPPRSPSLRRRDRRARRAPRALQAGALLALATLAPRTARAHRAHRPVPEYSSRPRPAPSPWLWIPRALLAPLHLVFQSAIREPTLFVARMGERTHAGSRAARILHPADGLTVVPMLNVDVGMATTAGLYLEWADPSLRDHALRLDAATGGDDIWLFHASDTYQLGPWFYAAVTVAHDDRADHALYGRVPGASDDAPLRFRAERTQVALEGGYRVPHASLALVLAPRWDLLAPGHTPSVSAGDLVQMPGAGRAAWYTGEVLAGLDGRNDGGTGPWFRARARYQVDADAGTSRSFLFTALAAGVAWTSPARSGLTLGMDLYAARIDPLGSAPVPLYDLVTLGGDRLQGFLPGRIRAESAGAARITATLPIEGTFEANAWVGTGGGFGPSFAGMTPGALRGEAGVGASTGVGDHARLRLFVAMGTSRFDAPFAVESGRFYFALDRSF